MNDLDRQPERYVVYWYDWDKCKRLSAEQGVQENDIDIADIEETRDFDRLRDVRRFLKQPLLSDGRTAEESGGFIERRVNIRNIRCDQWAGWGWEQERLA